MDSIVIDKLNFGYMKETVIENLNLKVEEGKIIIIEGENGSGKSTLLKLILGELKPNSGDIKIFEKPLSEQKIFQVIGYMPQVNVISKIPFPITCLEMVSLNKYHDYGLIKIPKKKHIEESTQILCKMGLQEYLNTPFNELSGGLQQRVMISHAMINNPKILILDEPTAGIDEESKNHLFDVLKKLNDEYHITIVLVSHEISAIKEHMNIDDIYRLENKELKNV